MGQRVTGPKQIMQVLWVYEHPLDFDGVRRFHHNLSRGLLGRRIERSPLPFARYRWVSDPGPTDLDIAEHPRPRADVSDWADERSQIPVDPESGPGWHLAVLPLTDGSTAVSLVISHYLLDGLGLVVSGIEALSGITHDFGYPPPRSRTRRRALVEDARQTAQQAPEIGRALVAAARQARNQRQNTAQPQKPRPPMLSDTNDVADPVVVPTVTALVDLAEWDACAAALGGTSKTLLAGFVAKFAEHVGRRRAGDDTVTVQLPISTRAEGDMRANAVSFARVSVDPTRVTTDLREVRAAIKQALVTLRETSTEESSQVASLIPFIPKRVLKRLSALDYAMLSEALPVLCSNLGDLGSVVCRLDGSDAEFVTGRLGFQHLTRQWLERTGGLMTVQSWRLHDRIVISVGAYQPGADNTKLAMRELAARTLDEFNLTGDIT
ncbi:MAG: hypothetical protein VX424_18980 [Actinomycetota bacterium]|nr:hypothetical protein [Actinomycetota bacterium]